MASIQENKDMSLCCYYQAEVDRPNCWFLVAVMRSFEHMAFDRTLDKATSTFEFFVPRDTEQTFLEVAAYFEQKNIMKNLVKLPNRFV